MGVAEEQFYFLTSVNIEPELWDYTVLDSTPELSYKIFLAVSPLANHFNSSSSISPF